MSRFKTDNGLRSLFCLILILLGSINSIKGAVITARTLVEFRTAGWIISGENPATYARPGAWKGALRPLDAGVTGSSVWRVTQSSDTIFRFGSFVSELCANSIKVEVTYFMDNSVVSVYPWKNTTGSESFYPERPIGIQWVTEKIEIRPGNVIEFKMNVIPGSGGFLFFDQVSIEHDGVKCDTTTTEASTVPDTTRTTEDSSGWTEETPVEETVEPGTTITDEETSSTTQITTEEPLPTTPDEGIPEEPETDPTNIPIPSTTSDVTDTTTDNGTTESDTTGSTEGSTTESDITGSTEGSTTESDITRSTEGSTTESDITRSTESSTTESDNTGSTESSTTESDITGSTEGSTTESDITESTVGSTTDNEESSESSTTLSPITPSIPPTSGTTSSSTESTSETTLSTNPSSNTPRPPLSTSTTKIPVTILPPPLVLPGAEEQGLTVQQILLYIVLPTAVGITAFLGTVFYFGFKGTNWWGFGSRGSKEQLIRGGLERVSNRGGGRSANPISKYPTQISPPQQTNIPSRQIGNNVPFYPSPSHQQPSPAFPQSTPLQTTATQFPRQSPSAFQSQFSNRNAPQIPPTASRPNVGKSVTLNIPNQEEIYYGTSEPSNWNGSFSRSPVTYTGEYTGGELPRIRRKMD